MKKVFVTVLIATILLMVCSLQGLALEEPEKISIPEIKTTERVNYYLPEISTVLDITAANSDEPYSEVTVTNPATTTEPETSSKETATEKQANIEEPNTGVTEQKNETIKETTEPPVELATSDKAVVAIAATILVVVVTCIVTLNRQKGKEEETL